MGWLDTLIKKIPTLRGIADFFYVATHWSTISHEREEYRRQIKDREDWLKAQEENLKKIHQLETRKITTELEGQVKTWHDRALEIGELYVDALVRLTVVYYLEPLKWELERHSLNAKLRQTIEGLMATLPPPPPALDITERRLSDILGPPPPPLSEQTPSKKA